MRRRLENFSFGNFRFFIIAGLAAAGLLLAGHGNAIADSGDDSFLLTLDHYGVPYGTRAAGVGMGHAACAALSVEGPVQAAMDTAEMTGITPMQGSYVVGAAIGAYCPQYKSEVPQ